MAQRIDMDTSLNLITVRKDEENIFLEMAADYFSELNPNFVPLDAWKRNFFESIQSDQNMSLRWVMVNDERAGFMIFGIKEHRYMPTIIGVICEFYIRPTYRRTGLGTECARRVIDELQRLGVSKIQLEVVVGNTSVAVFWEKLGFLKVSERFALQK